MDTPLVLVEGLEQWIIQVGINVKNICISICENAFTNTEKGATAAQK